MIARLDEGFDVVSGWRKKRHDSALTRLLPSRMANWLIAKITGVRLHDFGCTLKAYRRDVIAETKLYGEMHRFILDLITVKFLVSFSTKPIYVFGGLGMLTLLGSVVCGLIVLYQKMFSDFSMNRNALFYLTVLLITASIQFILMGLLAEMLVRTYHESQNRPTYVIKEILESSEVGGEIE